MWHWVCYSELPPIWFSRPKQILTTQTLCDPRLWGGQWRDRDGVIFLCIFFVFFYMENTVQVPSDLPGLKAHGIHWATDVSILETQRKRKKRGTSLLQFNLRAARFFNQIIFLGNSSAAAHRLGLVFRVCLGANWYKVAISHWEMWTVTESLWFNPFYDACTPEVPVVGTMLHLF